MNYGYNNKILIVNLSDSSVKIENPGEQFFRKYMGGSALGVYYCLREIPKGADPLGPDNVLVFAPGVLTGAPIPCASRYTVTAKSPLTGGIGDAQAGGWWAPGAGGGGPAEGSLLPAAAAGGRVAGGAGPRAGPDAARPRLPRLLLPGP